MNHLMKHFGKSIQYQSYKKSDRRSENKKEFERNTIFQ